MKKGTKIKVRSNRFEKLHNSKEFVLVKKDDVLTYEGQFDGRLIFSDGAGRRISIDKNIFNIKNYKRT